MLALSELIHFQAYPLTIVLLRQRNLRHGLYCLGCK